LKEVRTGKRPLTSHSNGGGEEGRMKGQKASERASERRERGKEGKGRVPEGERPRSDDD